jgi:hypothetical protein
MRNLLYNVGIYNDISPKNKYVKIPLISQSWLR